MVLAYDEPRVRSHSDTFQAERTVVLCFTLRKERSVRERRESQWVAGAVFAAAAITATYVVTRSKADETVEIVYPPLDTPKPLTENIWIVDSGPIKPAGLALPLRMTVFRTSGGDLLLHSPCRHTPALARALEAIGPVKHLIAPTTAHWTFLKSWQDAIANATTWAVPGLRDRAQVRASGVRIDRDLADEAPLEWRDDIRQGLIRGRGLCEAYFFHTPSRTLVLTDLIENLAPAKLPPVTAAVMRALLATRGTVALHARAALLMGGADTRAAIRAMLELAPETVLFAHGDVFTDDAEDRLRQAFAWLS